jgi:hypothetical protein
VNKKRGREKKRVLEKKRRREQRRTKRKGRALVLKINHHFSNL